MPYRALSDERRRAVTLAALSGESPSELATKHGISPQHVHKLRREAAKNAEAEYEFWSRVVEILEERGEK